MPYAALRIGKHGVIFSTEELPQFRVKRSGARRAPRGVRGIYYRSETNVFFIVLHDSAFSE